MFQEGALFSSLTVKQNIQAPMREYLELSQRLMDELAMLKMSWSVCRRTRRTNFRRSCRAA